GTSDVFSLLKKVENKKVKMEELRAAEPEKADALVEEEKWNKALKHADGEKVKDDIALLKKAAKRKRKAKEQSAKEWADRQKTLKKSMVDRQKKRTDNLKARSEGKLKGKGGGIKKKSRPGFEGSARKKKST
ncbi:hypothetical protein HK405_009740, partial [Cladochytrium tenue]